MEILDNATLWVGVSFVLFILLVFKPLLKSTNRSLDDKITNIKNKLKKTNKKKENQLKQRLKQTKIKFENEISSEILRSSIDVTKKRIINDLSDSKNNSLVENSIDEVNIKLN